MNLVVDYGNTFAKVGIFEDGSLRTKHAFPSSENLKEFLANSSAENLIVSTVSENAEQIFDWTIRAKRKFMLTHTLPLPVKNLYATPATLGVDRLAAVCGAWQLFTHQNCLIIDAGTCITYDFINHLGEYLGGGISPGLRMRFQAVHTFTARLPLVNPVESAELIGMSTETGIQSGIVNGIICEIEGFIRQYEEKFPHLRVILCGGDTSFFENNLKAPIFAVPELVLSGLNSILIYNVNH
jgi:type III pantothenate kinase